MPTYAYRCLQCGEELDVKLPVDDRDNTTIICASPRHPVLEGPAMRRVITPAFIHVQHAE